MTVVETGNMATYKDVQHNIILDNINALKTTSDETTSMQMHQDDSTCERLSATSESTMAARVKTPDHPWRSGWLRKAGVNTRSHLVQPLPSRETTSMPTHKDAQDNIIRDNIHALKTTSGGTTSMQMHQDDSTGERLSATSESTTAARVKTPDHPWRSGWLRKAGVQLEKHTVDVNDIEDGFPDQEFQEKTRQIKIIELKEAKQALREALIRDEQKVDHERDRQVMRSDCKASIDKHEASVADNKFIRCAKNESRVSCARHSVARNTFESAHDQPEGSKPNTKAGFFKSLAKSIRTKREEAMTRQARDNGGSFDSSAKSLCMESTPASEGRMQQAVEQFGAIRDAGMHLSRSSSSQDADENTLMKRLMRLQRLGSLLDSPDTPDRLMSWTSSA